MLIYDESFAIIPQCANFFHKTIRFELASLYLIRDLEFDKNYDGGIGIWQFFDLYYIPVTTSQEEVLKGTRYESTVNYI